MGGQEVFSFGHITNIPVSSQPRTSRDIKGEGGGGREGGGGGR